MLKQIFIKIKGLLSQNEGLGYLQVYNLLKTAGIVIISIIFARFIKTPSIINTWETLMLIGTSYTFFYVSGLGYTLVSFVKRYHKNVWPAIFQNTFLLLFSFGTLSFVAIFVTGFYLKSISFPGFLLLLFGIYIMGTVCSTIIEYIYFLNKSYRKLFFWGTINLILFITISTLPILLGYGIVFSIYALAIFGLLKFLFTLSLIQNLFNFKNLSYIKPLMAFNWPIIVSLLFGTGYVYVAGFILKAKVSDIDFNLFRYGSREFPLFIVLANSFSIVLGGITTEKYMQPDFWKEIKKSHLRLMHQLFPLACIFMLGSKYIFQFIFSSEFTLSYPIFNIALLTIIVRLLFPQSLLMGRGNTKLSFYSAIVEFIVGIVLVFALTPKFGIQGAALGLALAYFIEKLLLIFFCYNQKIPFHKSISWKWYTGYCLLLILCFGWSVFY